MAGELWNRVNIPFPSAVSSVRVHFSSTTDANVKNLLAESGTSLKLLRSEILQTEVRVLYELLYILQNSFRGNKTYKGLKQVEQCINRLKSMKLDVALQELTELCPNRIQRGVSIKLGECELPSQPFLEWICLKVLGAGQLMDCTLDRCRRAFVLSKQQMKWEEFVILNVVITSALSRLWVICRGVLLSLSSLYQQLLELLREVAHARPMPFLTDFPLPADMPQFLGPTSTFSLSRQSADIRHAKDGRKKEQRGKKNRSVKAKIQRQVNKVKDDLGVAVERGLALDASLKPFLKVFGNFTEGKSSPRGTHEAEKKRAFKKRVRETASFREMATHLEEMIAWCKSQKMKKEKRLLTFLRLKCQRLKSLEAAGYDVQRKLRTFGQEARWASSPQGSVPRTCRSPAAARRDAHPRTRFHSLRSRFKSSAARVKQKQPKSRRKVSERSGETRRTADLDDIDGIFASVGL